MTIADPVLWWASLGRPLRHLSRLQSILVLAVTVAAAIWASAAVQDFRTYQESQRTAREVANAGQDEYGDMALYRRINARVAAGESYYTAATDEQRSHGYPTIPFVTVRTPVLAWGNMLFGAAGWRIIAVGALIITGAVLIHAVTPATVLLERAALGLMLLGSGAAVFYIDVHLSHDLLSGLLLSLAIVVYRPGCWWPALLSAAAGVALRELAAPFLMLWLVFALSQKRLKEAGAVALACAVLAFGLWLHSRGVAAARMPGDLSSQGWSEMHGPAVLLAGMADVSVVRMMPGSWSGPLTVLPLLGWIGLGGRQALFMTLWMVGMGIFFSLFARWDNFYWALLLLPLYLAGLALVPHAVADLVVSISDRKGAAKA